MNVDLDEDSEEQRPSKQSLWKTLQRDTHWKCLILTLLIYGCLAAIAWCRLTEVTKVIVNFSQFPITSTRQTSPCDDGYIYIPMAFLVMLYLVYLVECWHCTTRLDLKYKIDVTEVYERIQQMREAIPIIWWKAICYHYVRRTRQVTRYRNGDAYTTTQVYYERINSHSSGATFVFTQCGVKDISKKLLDLEKFPATKIRFSKSFAFANLEAANEFEEQRARFFQENERHDDYMEMREGLDLMNVNFKEYMIAFADQLPFYISHLAFWFASFFLLSWPLRILFASKTAYVHYHVTKLFGVNYVTPAGQLITNYGSLLTPSSTMTSADIEWNIRNNFTNIPSYSEALLMDGGIQRSLLRHNSSGSVLVHRSDSNANFPNAHLVRAISSSVLANASRRSSLGQTASQSPADLPLRNTRHSWNPFSNRSLHGRGIPVSVTRFSLQNERIIYQTLPLSDTSPDSTRQLKPPTAHHVERCDSPPDYDVAIRVCRPVTLTLPRSQTDRNLQRQPLNQDNFTTREYGTNPFDVETAL